jgi:DNA-binding SARP family transcriptional activator
VSPAARQCRILTYGFDAYGLDDQDPTRLLVAPNLDAVLTEAQATARPIVEVLAEEPALRSSFRLRAALPEEGWEPAIVIAAGSPLADDETATLAALAGTGGQGAAVVIAGADATWTLEADDPAGWWRLSPIGLRVRPVGLAGDELRDIAGFLAEADAEPVAVDMRRDELDLRTPTGDTANGEAPRRASAGPAFQEKDWKAMVRLLGVVDLVNREGRPAAGDRDQPLEFLAWLITHRDTATRTGAMEALWAGRRVEPHTLHNVLSSARNLLRSVAGEPPDGGEWIPGRRERLILHRAVVSDYELLLDRLAYARRAAPPDAAAVLADGVDLMRGVPMEGTEWQWADDQSVRSRLAVQAVEMATQLAALRLEAGDMRGASEASELGHAVIPFHDECTALAIQALAAAGDRPAALAKYDDYERQAMSRGEAIAPEVAKVRNDLLRT